MSLSSEPDVPAAAPSGAVAFAEIPQAATPGRTAIRRLMNSKGALVAVAVLLFVVLTSLAAPLWGHWFAHTDQFRNHVSDTITLHGKPTNVVSLEGTPIGPTYGGRYFLGADPNGRDVMVRLLYAGRTSLLIGVIATFISLFFGALFGMLAGYYRGWVDTVISRALDVLWAFPVILLGVALGVATATSGLNLWIFHINSGSLLLPSAIIGVVNVVYIARPIRGIVLSLRERAFVEAAVSQDASGGRILRREIFPNLVTSLLVLAPIVISQTVSLEAALSFLGAGVQPPTPSWGTMISDGLPQIITAPHLTIIPGIVLVATILSLNIIGDVVREALDPRGTLRAAEGDKR
jgi:peptide/nickel transport system permease protein